MRTIKNKAPISVLDRTGSAHSSDGKYTTQQSGERPGGLGSTVSTGPAPLPIVMKRTGSVLRATLDNVDALDSALPAEWSAAERERWAEDNRLRYRLWLNDRYGTDPEDHEPPTMTITSPNSTEEELVEAIEDTPVAAYARGARAGDFQNFVADTGIQGYGASSDSGMDPAATPYQVHGDIRETSGHQRSTILAIHQVARGARNFTMGINTPWDDAHVSYFGDGGLETRLTVNQSGELVRLEREPADSDRHPWKAPQNLTGTAEFAEYQQRIHAAAALGS